MAALQSYFANWSSRFGPRVEDIVANIESRPFFWVLIAKRIIGW